MTGRMCRWAPVWCAGLIMLGGVLFAGPLDPPAGSIAPTPGPEPRIAINETNTPGDADSLFRITQPGSYYLERYVKGVAGKAGIEIVASDVTIDLMGFTLEGVAGSLDGIGTSETNIFNLTIRNGVIRGWGEDGVDVPGVAMLVEKVKAYDNSNQGFRVVGADLRDCQAFNNSGTGISFFEGSAINCTAIRNGGHGISAGPATIVRNCVASYNESSGIDADSAIVRDCMVRGNQQHGISVSSSCQVLDNSCEDSFGAGRAGLFVSGSDNRIEGNNCTNNFYGVRITGSGNFIMKNTCSGNTTNWNFAADNFYSNIVDRSGATTNSVNGSSAVSTLGTVDHTANFTY